MRESTIRRLIKIVEESNIESLEITRFFRKVRITKKINTNGQGNASAVLEMQPSAPAASAPDANPHPPPPAPAAAPVPAEKEASGLEEVISPMVGTFYRAPSPDSDAFVEVGTRVSPGDTVCIIEAMKLMNEIEAEVAGVIKEICVQNAEPVEYGQVLFKIDPKG
jgi:acetyl-CoA carboxylase biotin carboxyl carrier protein